MSLAVVSAANDLPIAIMRALTSALVPTTSSSSSICRSSNEVQSAYRLTSACNDNAQARAIKRSESKHPDLILESEMRTSRSNIVPPLVPSIDASRCGRVRCPGMWLSDS